MPGAGPWVTITSGQVSAALAQKAGAPKASTVAGVDTCTWTTKAGVKVTYAEHPLTAAAGTDLDALAADDKNLVIAGVGDKSIAQCTKGGPTSMECRLTGILALGRNSQGKD